MRAFERQKTEVMQGQCLQGLLILGKKKQSFNGADNGWLPTFYFFGQT